MTEHGATAFPFSAIVGSEQLKQALLLNVVDPRIGGVLIRGDRGTAKSTIVRALGALLPPITTREGCAVQCDPGRGHCAICGSAGAPVGRATRVVDLPLGATEDRIVGSIDLTHALSSGQRRFEPGLLAAAHRGVLYIDEVNLLPDHLVDLLLDVAASGLNVVEREGVSMTHPAEFVLVGTMNPDEGELRPQLLDRFGLIVDVRTPTDVEVRAEVVRRRIAYDADAGGFLERFEDAERSARRALLSARNAVRNVRVPEPMVRLAVQLCVEAGADGLRPDITMYRASAALAALAGRTEVYEDDVLEAALLVLPHRQREPGPGQPAPPSVADLVAAHRAGEPGAQPDDEPEDSGAGGTRRRPRPPATPGPARTGGTAPDGTGDGQTASDYTPPAVETITIPLRNSVSGGRTEGGRRGSGNARRGRAFGAQPWDGHSHRIAVSASIAAAARRGTARPIAVDLRDLRMYRQRGPTERLVLLLVDGSGSMGAHERMARTKAALRSVVERLYVHRDRVALAVFRDGRADLLVPPGRNRAAVRAAIEALPTGGGTPLVPALRAGAAVLRRDQHGHPEQASLVILVTDGRSREDARAAAHELRSASDEVLVVDTEAGPVRLGRARELADWLDAAYEALP